MMPPSKPSFKEALKFWFKLGWISFGGPAGQIAIMHSFLVDKHRWISDKKFLHALNYCMLLPGPEAQQLATYTGWLLHGKKGGLAAGLLFIIPSIFILLLLSVVYVTYGELGWVNAMFSGLKPAVVAVVLFALVKIGKKSLITNLHIGIAICSFIAIFFFNIPFPLIILATAVTGLIVYKFSPTLLTSKSSKVKEDDSEQGYFLTTKSEISHLAFDSNKFVKQLVIFFGLWCLPLGLFFLASNDFVFWRQLSVFFTQAAFVTFGGAYAVLPYVAQEAVNHFGWLSSHQMIDGLALGETTPGPLVMVLAFVGYMGAYNNSSGNIFLGGLGLITTTYYTFLPCFFFIFGGGPVIEQTQKVDWIKAVLSLITAAVTGVILNLTLFFAEAVLFGDSSNHLIELNITTSTWTNLLWILISFIALFRFKTSMLIWFAISAIAGLIYFLVQS